MSVLKRNKYRKKLETLLSRSDDEAFFQMIWAVDALQSDRTAEASRYIRFPLEAATSDIGSRSSLRKWELETLICQLLLTRKDEVRSGKYKITNCGLFDAAANAVNFLRRLEDAEAAIYLRRLHVLNEVHRIGHRQFPWQRGYFNVVQFYRFAYIYGQGDCARYFNETTGLTVSDFSLIGFGLHAGFLFNSALKSNFPLSDVGISHQTIQIALKRLYISVRQAREHVRADASKAAGLPTAYLPSFLRQFPIVGFGANNERLRSPLPQLILLRVTSGVYYDIVGGPSALRNEAADRFEQYSASYVTAMMPRFLVGRSYRYSFQGNKIDTPDVLIKDAGEIVVAMECKATKLTFGAQYSDDPVAEAKAGI